MKSFGNLILMAVICVAIFIAIMAMRPANAGMQGNLPTPVQALPKYPPVVCVAPNWAITPCRDRQPQVPQPVSDHMPSLVGERGPEMFIPNMPGTIVPMPRPDPRPYSDYMRYLENYHQSLAPPPPRQPASSTQSMLPIPTDEAIRNWTRPENRIHALPWDLEFWHSQQAPPIPDLVDEGVLRFNDPAWEKWLARQPRSQNIEDLRTPLTDPHNISGQKYKRQMQEKEEVDREADRIRREPSLVGGSGPEMFVPTQPGTIVPLPGSLAPTPPTQSVGRTMLPIPTDAQIAAQIHPRYNPNVSPDIRELHFSQIWPTLMAQMNPTVADIERAGGRFNPETWEQWLLRQPHSKRIEDRRKYDQSKDEK